MDFEKEIQITQKCIKSKMKELNETCFLRLDLWAEKEY